MQQNFLPVKMYHIAVDLPERRIYARLGFRKATTKVSDAERAKIEPILREGLLACQPRGVYLRRRIQARDHERIVLEGGLTWESRQLAAFLADARDIFVCGTTVGPEVLALRDAYLQQGQTFQAVILDAVASEVVESAMQQLHEYTGKLLRKELKTVTTRRYSPGYGDFALRHQQEIVPLLQFNDLGVQVNEHHLLLPEKSVTAVIGIV